MIKTEDFRKRGMRCRYHRHAAGEFECACCHQHFCPECAEEVSGHYYCSVCQHRLAARPAVAMPGMKQDAEQDIDKAGELGFDIDLLRRKLEALEGTVVMTTAAR